jgi:hypothetical protein
VTVEIIAKIFKRTLQRFHRAGRVGAEGFADTQKSRVQF